MTPPKDSNSTRTFHQSESEVSEIPDKEFKRMINKIRQDT
jgi:hypothetical protein